MLGIREKKTEFQMRRAYLLIQSIRNRLYIHYRLELQRTEFLLRSIGLNLNGTCLRVIFQRLNVCVQVTNITQRH